MGVRDLSPGNCVWAPSFRFHLLQSLRAIVQTGKRQQCELMQDTTASKKTQGPPRVSALGNKAEMLTKNGKKHGQQRKGAIMWDQNGCRMV